MIQNLFPKEVNTITADKHMWDGLLYPEEYKYVERAALKRRKEFTAGRLCARKALSKLGIPHFPILVDSNRAPIWPKGVLGSISHCDGFCGAAVTQHPDILGVGLDAELSVPLDKMTTNMVCTQKEQEWIRNTRHLTHAENWGKIIFSAKESVYKCLFPATQAPLEFNDVELTINDAKLTFSVEIFSPFIRKYALGSIYGYILMDEKYVYTGAVLYRNNVFSSA